MSEDHEVPKLKCTLQVHGRNLAKKDFFGLGRSDPYLLVTLPFQKTPAPKGDQKNDTKEPEDPKNTKDDAKIEDGTKVDQKKRNSKQTDPKGSKDDAKIEDGTKVDQKKKNSKQTDPNGPIFLGRSKLIMKNLNPQWLPFLIRDIPDVNRILCFEVYDWDRTSKDDLIGTLYLSLNEIELNVYYALKDAKGKITGELIFENKVVHDAMTVAAPDAATVAAHDDVTVAAPDANIEDVPLPLAKTEAAPDANIKDVEPPSGNIHLLRGVTKAITKFKSNSEVFYDAQETL